MFTSAVGRSLAIRLPAPARARSQRRDRAMSSFGRANRGNDGATVTSGGEETQESNRCVSQQGAAKRRTRARGGYAAWASPRRPQHLPGRELARQCNVAARPWHAFGLRSGNMKGDTAPASSIRRQLLPQHRAVERLRVLAKPYRLRVQVDAEGFPIIPGRYGQIEWHCDGVNCSACALQGQVALAVYTDRPRLFEKLWAIPGVKRYQTGDTEMRAVFPPEAMDEVARVIKARRRRSLSPAEARRLGMKTAYRVTSQAREPSSSAGPRGVPVV